MTFKVIWDQGQGQEMTSVPYRDYFLQWAPWQGQEVTFSYQTLWGLETHSRVRSRAAPRHTTHAPSVGSGMLCCEWRSSEDWGTKGWDVAKEFPSSLEKGSGRGLYPSPENFLISEWKMVHFGALCCCFCRLTSYKLSLPESLKLSPPENSYTL